MSGLTRSLGLRSLTLAVVSGTIGSGWLFAPFYAARSAGAASLIAWLLGGVLSFCLAMVFAELGALVPSSALAQIPMLSHGRLAGFIGGWCAWLAYLALPAIEVLAMVQYLASDLPWLTLDGGQGQVLSPWGLGYAAVLLVLMTWVKNRHPDRLEVGGPPADFRGAHAEFRRLEQSPGASRTARPG